MSVACYLVGAPGSGKTSLMAATVDRLGSRSPRQLLDPIPHVVHEPSRWVELGKRRDHFSGTDALGYAVMPKAKAFVESPRRPRYLLGEGDRLATSSFLSLLSENYDQFLLVYLDGDHIAATRAADRAAALGKPPQSASWWIGRASKARRLADEFDALRLDAHLHLSHLADALADALIRRMRSDA